VSDGIVCRECRGVNAPGTTTCRHCLSSLRSADPTAPPRFEPERMRQMQRVLSSEGRLIQGLRWLYVGYAGYLAWLAVRVLAAADTSTPSAQVAGYMLLPLVALAIVIVAILHLENEPFACAVALAGLQTIHLADALTERHGSFPHLTLTLTLVLWAAVLATARSGRILREWQARLAFVPRRSDEVRTVLAIVLIYAGTLALAVLHESDSLEGRLVFYGGVVALATASMLLLGRHSAKDTLPLRCRWGPALLLTLAVTVIHFLFVWWYFSLRRGQWTPIELAPVLPTDIELLLAIMVLPALCEEWLCRGVLWTAVRRSAGPAATILVTASLFALLHRHGSRAHHVVPIQLVGGLMKGWLRARTGSVIPGMLSHAAYNGSLVWLLMFA
jgi:membrane protease YdiL (CAAX protease family)